MKKICFRGFFAIVIVFLCFVGIKGLWRKDIITEEKKLMKMEDHESTEKTKNEKNTEEWIYSEALDMEYPEVPAEPGVQIIVSDGIKLPEDRLLEKLSVYEYHEALYRDSSKQQKKRADKLAEMLLMDFFPGKQWKKKVIADKYQENYVYRIKGQKKNGFQYTANHDGIDNTQLICEKGVFSVAEPEDGDWDQAFREYSLSMLESFETGLWDGKNSHMAVSCSEKVAGNNGNYRYMIELDGIMATKYMGFSFHKFSNWASFQYRDGSLVSMFQMAQKVLDGKRPMESPYENMKAAFGKLKEELQEYLTVQGRQLQRYYCVRLDRAAVEYVDYYSMAGPNVFVPVLNAYLKMGTYDIAGGAWTWDDNYQVCYLLQLETGESDMGRYYDDYYTWQAPMTDKL